MEGVYEIFEVEKEMFSMSIKRYMLFLITYIVVLVFFPLASRNLPDVFGSFYAFSALWLVSLLFYKPSILWSKPLRLCYLYCIVWLLYLYFFIPFGTYANKEILNDFFSLIVPISIICYFYKTRQFDCLARVVLVALVCIIITAFITIISSAVYPEISREIAGLTFSPEKYSLAEISLIQMYNKLGCASRPEGWGFICLMVGSVFFLKFYKKDFSKKILCLILLVLSLVALAMMQFSTLFICALILWGLLNVSVKNRNRKVILFSFLILLFVSIPKQFYANSFYFVSSFFSEGSSMQSRLIGVGDYILLGDEVGEDNAVAARLDIRYEASLDKFISAPFLGKYSPFSEVSNYYVGEGHLFWMNLLVTRGIFLFLIFCSAFYSILKVIYYNTHLQFRYFLLVTWIIFIAYGFVKVIIIRNCYMSMFVILPGLYYLPLLSKQNKKLHKN